MKYHTGRLHLLTAISARTLLYQQVSYRRERTSSYPLRNSCNSGRGSIQLSCLEMLAANISIFQEQTPTFLHVKYLLLSKTKHSSGVYPPKIPNPEVASFQVFSTCNLFEHVLLKYGFWLMLIKRKEIHLISFPKRMHFPPSDLHYVNNLIT